MNKALQRRNPNYRQVLTASLGLLLGLGIFICLERAVTPRYNWVTPLDELIPFTAHSWWVYVLFFPFVLFAAAYASVERFKAFRTASGIAFGVALLCFWLFPNSYPGPTPD